MRRILLSLAITAVLTISLLFAQAPGSIDAEGNKYWANGTGRYPLKRKGVWKVSALTNPGGNFSGVPGATAAEMQAMTGTLDRLSAVFKATPEASVLQGYWMHESRTLNYAARVTQPPSVPVARIPFSFGTRFFPFVLEDVLKNGQYVPQFGGETQSVEFIFNRLPGDLGRETILEEKFPNEHVQNIYQQPRVTGTYLGFPVLEGQDLMIARPGRSPWAPVSYARALKLAMAKFEQDKKNAEEQLVRLKQKLAETMSPAYEQQARDHLEKYSGQFRTTDPRKWQGRVEGMQQTLKYDREKAARDANPQRDKDGQWYWNPIDAHAQAARQLAALTPADESAPACYQPVTGEQATWRTSMRGNIAKLGGNPACEALVTDNFSYFDMKLPRTEPQIMLVRSLGRCVSVKDGQLIWNERPRPNEPSHGCKRHPSYWEQMDWTMVAELVLR